MPFGDVTIQPGDIGWWSCTCAVVKKQQLYLGMQTSLAAPKQRLFISQLFCECCGAAHVVVVYICYHNNKLFLWL